jgi:murein tripeptide amidase MpaA
MTLRLTRVAAIGSAFCFFLTGGSPQSAPNYLVEVKTANAQDIGHRLEESGFDVASISTSKSMVQVVTADPSKLERFANNFGLETNEFEVTSVVRSVAYSNFRSEDGQEDYFDHAKTKARLQQLADAHRSIAKVYNLNEWLGLPKTREGNDIFALQISRNPGQIEDEPKIAFVAQHHARELMTHHTVLDTAAHLLQEIQAGNQQYTKAINESAIWFIPVINPDGLDYVFASDRMWRKNRSTNSDGSRGVDLNRNYEFKWGECGQNSSTPSSDIFKGSAANSEPEVQLMDELNDRLHFQYLISYHSSGNEVLYPYRCGELAESSVIHDLRDRLAAELNFGQRYGSSSGEDYEHHYANYGTLAFLLEIGEEFQPEFSEYENTVFPNVRKVLPFIIEELQAPALEIKVTDRKDSKAIEAKISIDEISFQEGEKRHTDAFGSYRWRLDPGTYHVNISAPGFKSQKLTVQIPSQSLRHEVKLERSI